MGFVGTHGILDIEDTYRDVIIAVTLITKNLDLRREDEIRHVDFLTSFPPETYTIMSFQF